MYAVIDTETTGLRTSWHDRVVEIAVVHLDERGRVEDEWCSLVNPDRDLGPQHIHGITAAEARRAPSFGELAGHLTERLAGRTIVAHNLHFDAGFLIAEYRRMGVEIPLGADHGLCTMRLATHFLPAASRSLHGCRSAAGLPSHRAHSALHDAHATAELLAFYLAAAGSPPPWAHAAARATVAVWPSMPRSVAEAVRRRTSEYREEHFLARLIDRLPPLREPRADGYLGLLDRALLDRHISASEADALIAAAESLGLARADVAILHETYLAQLAELALADHVLTDDEQRDLDAVAGLLGLPHDAVKQALKNAPQGKTSDDLRWQLRPGDLVVFTGSMDPPRDHWQAQAAEAGLRVGDNVTKRTKLLIAADPDSMSGKAKKAREYEIPIVHPVAYRRMLDDLPRPQNPAVFSR